MIKKVLLCLSLAAALWLGSLALGDLWRYLRLSATAPATVRAVKVCRISDAEYAVKISYVFRTASRLCKGKTVLGKPYHLNLPAAEKAAQEIRRRNWTVHYNPSRPKNSTIEKVFPLKTTAYAGIALAIAIYFVILEQLFPEVFAPITGRAAKTST